MEMTFKCQECHAVGHVPDVERAGLASCHACGTVRPLHPAVSARSELSACGFCATEDLYIQKDFPHGLGLAIVIVGFLISTIYWYFYRPIGAMAVLLVTAALDVILYYLVPDVTICYRCLSQFRGVGANPGQRILPFDLAIGERYRQERLRVEELRKENERSGSMSHS
jgi:hypothetical protein